MTLTTGFSTISRLTRMNSIYDPDTSIGGEDPYGKAEWAKMYEKYRVRAVKVKVACFNIGGSADDQGYTWIRFIDSITSTAGQLPQTATPKDLFNQHHVVKRVRGNNTGPGPVLVSAYKSVRSIEGRRIQGEDEYEALMSANPTRQPIIEVGVTGVKLPAANREFRLVTTVTYYVEMFSSQDGTISTLGV